MPTKIQKTVKNHKIFSSLLLLFAIFFTVSSATNLVKNRQTAREVPRLRAEAMEVYDEYIDKIESRLSSYGAIDQEFYKKIVDTCEVRKVSRYVGERSYTQQDCYLVYIIGYGSSVSRQTLIRYLDDEPEYFSNVRDDICITASVKEVEGYGYFGDKISAYSNDEKIKQELCTGLSNAIPATYKSNKTSYYTLEEKGGEPEFELANYVVMEIPIGYYTQRYSCVFGFIPGCNRNKPIHPSI